MASDIAPSESPSAANKTTERLLPPAFFSPLNLLWICVLPLILLLAMNAQAIWLAYGEIQGESKRHLALFVLLANGVLALGLAAVGLILHKAGKPLHSGWFLLLGALHTGFVWFDLYALGRSLPSSVPAWILDQTTLMLAQLACSMPGCFFSLLGFACFPSRLSRAKDMLLSGGLLTGIPLVWYLFFQVVRQLKHFPDPGAYVAIPVVILSTALMLIGLLRLLIRLHTWLSAYQGALVLITALALPLGGLLLNRAVPFPVNFQITGIYVLTVLNALVLLAGCLPRFRQNPWIILSQALTFPFTLYFFVIFLPFLPLFVPAMLVMGAGFLILAPTVLFMVHGQRLVAVFYHLANGWGYLRSGLSFVAFMAVLPLWFTGQALLDRWSLHQALDYVYTPQLYPREAFSGSPVRVGKTLQNLVDFKEGQVLPVLSDLYNRVVFDNLFLPDAKMEELHQAFLGEPLPKAKHDRMENLSIWGATSNRQARSEPRMRPLQLPREKAVIESVESNQVNEGDCVRHTVVIRVKNTADVQNEWVATIDIPEVVLVSNYWLHIGKERVPGKLFEKKTALWVYEQIRDRTRRDPGILRYIGPTTLELRVFPLAAGEVRTTEIEFLLPKDLKVSMGIFPENRLMLKGFFPQSTEDRPVSRINYPEGAALLLGEGSSSLGTLPFIRQKAYLHFIIDRSLATGPDSQKVVEVLKKIAARPELAGVEDCKITLTNFESIVLGNETIPVRQLGEWLTPERMAVLPARGGFLSDKAVREEMLAYEEGLDEKNPASFNRFPLFIIVDGSNKSVKAGEALPYWIRSGNYPVYAASAADSYSSLASLDSSSVYHPSLERDAALVKAGGKIVAAARQSYFSQLAYLPQVEQIEIYDPASGFKPLKYSELKNEAYSKGLQAHAMETVLRRHPSWSSSLLGELVRQSKESGILVPATSYIVVENSAQWKILQLKEKQKLSGHEVMELQEASAPSWLILAALLALFYWVRSGWSRKRTVKIALIPSKQPV